MYVAATLLIIVGSLFAVANLTWLISSLVTKKFSSMVPPLGGLLLMSGFTLLPSVRPYAFCGLMLDVGFWALLFAMPMLLSEWSRSAPWRRIARISGEWSDVTFHLSLYRNDYYVVRVARTLPQGVAGWVGRGSYGQWKAIDKGIELVSHTDKVDAPARAILKGGLKSRSFTVVEASNPLDDDAPEFPPVGTLLQFQ